MNHVLSGYSILILGIAPFVGAGAIAFLHTPSFVSLLLVLTGMIIGAIFGMIAGTGWLQMRHREWMESQSVGFIFVPVILPALAYIGAVGGAIGAAILWIILTNP